MNYLEYAKYTHSFFQNTDRFLGSHFTGNCIHRCICLLVSVVLSTFNFFGVYLYCTQQFIIIIFTFSLFISSFVQCNDLPGGN